MATVASPYSNKVPAPFPNSIQDKLVAVKFLGPQVNDAPKSVKFPEQVN